jgi:hypothetical protein
MSLTQAAQQLRGVAARLLASSHATSRAAANIGTASTRTYTEGAEVDQGAPHDAAAAGRAHAADHHQEPRVLPVVEGVHPDHYNTLFLTGNVVLQPTLRLDRYSRPMCTLLMARNPRAKDKRSGVWKESPPEFYEVCAAFFVA